MLRIENDAALRIFHASLRRNVEVELLRVRAFPWKPFMHGRVCDVAHETLDDIYRQRGRYDNRLVDLIDGSLEGLTYKLNLSLERLVRTPIFTPRRNPNPPTYE